MPVASCSAAPARSSISTVLNQNLLYLFFALIALDNKRGIEQVHNYDRSRPSQFCIVIQEVKTVFLLAKCPNS